MFHVMIIVEEHPGKFHAFASFRWKRIADSEHAEIPTEPSKDDLKMKNRL